MENVLLSVSEFVAATNQTLEYAYPVVHVEGEIAEFKISQNQWVHFKIKDEVAVVSCFMTMFQMRVPLEDGMKVVVTASPKLDGRWGKFSLIVRAVRPVGEGSIKKGFELLKAKLEKEGLFAYERKRPLPRMPKKIAVITSTESAAYADFIKIINKRWGGLDVDVAHTQVQGAPAADQMIRAIHYFNSLEALPEVLVIIRGGGSPDDLAAFNDEPLARAIAESRIPTLVGVGHEVNHTLADMISDVRAATPTDAAQLLVPDRHEIIRSSKAQVHAVGFLLTQAIDTYSRQTKENLEAAFGRIQERLDDAFDRLGILRVATSQLNPEHVLRRGYALLRGDQTVGSLLQIETVKHIISAEVQDVRQK
ncbi:MAG: exodeoxyribonuclease VII large subunit [Candidatus Microsaccharimonas sossegonensis]|uniref:Exodeoxyribonuclease 7 large subunit n=1 Tax=Candidatus Microsaccharimonas sossegonensis TaxID=2506948 RepID=A0A4Q0AHE5_9BACT|nr:MAG: exodeoxyribonuclease VII large subunit [Candidatus Microsaccharimonas sossegonensis]